MGIRKFNLRSSKVTKMGNIRMNQPLNTTTLGKEHRECTVPFFCVNGWIRCLNSAFRKAQGFQFFLSLHHPNNRLENIYFFYLSLLNSPAINIFFRQKKYWRSICRPLHACCPDRLLINSCKEITLFSKDRPPSRESVAIVCSVHLHPNWWRGTWNWT